MTSALGGGHAHAFLFHGPKGVGKATAAIEFAAVLLGDVERVRRRVHPDLRVLEPLGEMIRIDRIHDLHHDLHMRPFEGDRRVYLILDAHRMNDEAANALLKDLEEPPPYATLVLVANELGPIPETIRSRCQLVPFRRLTQGAIRTFLAEAAPELSVTEVTTLARVAGGRLDRARSLLDPAARERRRALIEAARGAYRGSDPAEAAAVVLAGMKQTGAAAKEREEQAIDGLDLTSREAEQRVKRAQRGAEKDEMLAALELLAAWYRDLVVTASGAPAVAVNADLAGELEADAAEPSIAAAADEAAELCRASWRIAEELNVTPQLALEALFVRLAAAFAGRYATA
jgi:DNA polymerase III subunit delta'